MKHKNPSIQWTPEMVVIFLEEAVRVHEENGLATDTRFKHQDWNTIRTRTNHRLNMDIPTDKLQSKLNDLRKDYIAWVNLCNCSGFGWNEIRHIPTATDDVWADYVVNHPGAKKFRNHTLENEDLLDKLFEGRIATGEYAVSSNVSLHRRHQHAEAAVPIQSQDIGSQDEDENINTGGDMNDPKDIVKKLPSRTKVQEPPKKMSKMDKLIKSMDLTRVSIENLAANPTTRAIELFRTQYGARFDPQQRLIVVELFTDKQISIAFLSMDDEEREEFFEAHIGGTKQG